MIQPLIDFVNSLTLLAVFAASSETFKNTRSIELSQWSWAMRYLMVI